MPFEWLIDLIKDWVIAQGYATEAWVTAKNYATQAWVLAQDYASKTWVLGQAYLSQAFIGRGDPGAVDFGTGDFTKDGNWHELDLSGIIPPFTKGVLLNVDFLTPTIAAVIMIREFGNVNALNRSALRCQVSMIVNESNLISSVSTGQKIEYWITNTTWLSLNMTVKSWWF